MFWKEINFISEEYWREEVSEWEKRRKLQREKRKEIVSAVFKTYERLLNTHFAFRNRSKYIRSRDLWLRGYFDCWGHRYKITYPPDGFYSMMIKGMLYAIERHYMFCYPFHFLHSYTDKIGDELFNVWRKNMGKLEIVWMNEYTTNQIIIHKMRDQKE